VVERVAGVSDPKDGPPAISCSCKTLLPACGLDWYQRPAIPLTAFLHSGTVVPQKAFAYDDMKSVAYLCCPVQTKEGWSFITALTIFLKGEWDGRRKSACCPLENSTSRSGDRKHLQRDPQPCNWVVNYDELLDRRQLLNQNVKVIRYKQCSNKAVTS